MQSVGALDQTRALRGRGNRGKKRRTSSFFVVKGRLYHGFYHGRRGQRHTNLDNSRSSADGGVGRWTAKDGGVIVPKVEAAGSNPVPRSSGFELDFRTIVLGSLLR